jgi:hypothetical protein
MSTKNLARNSLTNVAFLKKQDFTYLLKMTSAANSPSHPQIDLNALTNAIPSLTTAFCTTLAEAASVCLENNDVPQPTLMDLRGFQPKKYAITRLPVTPQMVNTYNDLQFAAEFGAYGISFLIMQETLQFTVIERSVKGPGFDYWLGDLNDPLFQKKARLEVSGILKGDSSQIKSRVKQKKEQTQISSGEYPGYAAVIEFSAPQAVIEEC